MKQLLLTLALLGSALSASAQEYLEVAANPVGAGKGKKIVLVAGDEEYRTEESMPMLAKILAKTHGFNCIVLFSTDEKAGYIDPNNQKNIRGTEMLDDADLLIIGTRFRQLSDESLAHFAKFLNSGKPVIGFRTATHAFTGSAKTGDFKWGEFGLKILGDRSFKLQTRPGPGMVKG
jgi:microcompartment protein CcmK/EutM